MLTIALRAGIPGYRLYRSAKPILIGYALRPGEGTVTVRTGKGRCSRNGTRLLVAIVDGVGISSKVLGTLIRFGLQPQ